MWFSSEKNEKNPTVYGLSLKKMNSSYAANIEESLEERGIDFVTCL